MIAARALAATGLFRLSPTRSRSETATTENHTAPKRVRRLFRGYVVEAERIGSTRTLGEVSGVAGISITSITGQLVRPTAMFSEPANRPYRALLSDVAGAALPDCARELGDRTELTV